MHIFVSGGTGFIGSHFVRQALLAGHKVDAICRPHAVPRIAMPKDHVWRLGSMTTDWRHTLAKCDALVHFAAYGVAHGSNDWTSCFRVNLEESLLLWRQALDSGVRRLVICGSCFEYGRSGEAHAFIPVDAPLLPTTAYGASKASASISALALCVEYSCELAILRPFHVYGEGEAPNRFWPSLLQAANAGLDFPMSQGEQLRDFQPVSETAHQFLQVTNSLALQPGHPQIHNLGTGVATTLLNFAHDEWLRAGAKGSLLPGLVPYRPNEVMRYVPVVTLPPL